MKRTFKALRRVTFLSLLVACGARSGLLVDEANSSIESDAGHDGAVSATDGSTVVDDGGSTLDVRPPTDVVRTDCPDADTLLIYTMTDTNELQSFDPTTGQFKLISRIACPTFAGDTPFSMAVDRKGVAYVLFNTSHRIFRVSTLTGACIATAYTPDQHNFQLFGMGFATIGAGPAETLYVAGDSNRRTGGTTGAGGIATIDPTTFQLSVITNQEDVHSAELTGTGDGRLFAFYRDVNDTSPPSFIGQVDTVTGRLVGTRRFDSVNQGTGWAFAYWGGDFYMFHAPASSTIVTRFRPSDDSLSDIATTPLQIVGAGVSTCAPQD